MEPKAVLFDIDETLTNPEQSYLTYTRRFLRDFSDRIALPSATLEAVLEVPWRGYDTWYHVLRAILACSLWRKKLSFVELRQHWYDVHAQCVEPAEGLYDILPWLTSCGARIALVTNGYTDIQISKVQHLGIIHHIADVIISEEVQVKKPDPVIFRHALDSLRLAPRDTVMIGDHPLTDILGARAAKLPTVWLEGRFSWEGGVLPRKRIRKLVELKSLCYTAEMKT